MVGPPSGLKENRGRPLSFLGEKENMFIDLANIFVACLMVFMVASFIFVKISGDKVEKEERERKEKK